MLGKTLPKGNILVHKYVRSLALTRFELVRRARCTKMGVPSTVTTHSGQLPSC